MYMAVSRRAIPSAHPQTPGARPARSVSKSHPRLARRGRSCAEGAAPRAEAPLRFQVRAKLCYQRRACLPIPRLRLRAAPADVSRGASFIQNVHVPHWRAALRRRAATRRATRPQGAYTRVYPLGACSQFRHSATCARTLAQCCAARSARFRVACDHTRWLNVRAANG